MAANAVLRLIRQYDIDTSRVRYLALGTESSTDNSAGAIIVKGMVDRALEARGMAPISRSCEVPEFKHACLGGVYGMKGAIRHLALDGAGVLDHPNLLRIYDAARARQMQELGLAAGTPVVGGLFDVAASAVGSGGTAAGLSAGCDALGLGWQNLGFAVCDERSVSGNVPFAVTVRQVCMHYLKPPFYVCLIQDIG